MAFLAFEGIDSAGKSSLLRLLAKELEAKGLPALATREPGGTATGQAIRKILLSKQAPDPLTETLLYYADRKQHIEERIKPALKKGLWVLSDRYWASTSAYQSGARGVDEELIDSLRQTVCRALEPDLWILLDLPVKTALKRLSKQTERDRFEKEKAEFHQKVRDYYLKLAKKDPGRWLILQAENPPEKLLREILLHLQKKALLA